MPPTVSPALSACLRHTAAEGAPLMGNIIAQTLPALARLDDGRTPGVGEAIRQLETHAATLRTGLPEHLMAAFSTAAAGADPLESLTLMSDAQFRESQELLRGRQAATQQLDAAFDGLGPLVTAAQGMAQDRLNTNPLRPENFQRALRAAVAATGVLPAIQSLWLRPMSDALTHALPTVYETAAAVLRSQGIVAGHPVGASGAPLPPPTGVGEGLASSDSGGAPPGWSAAAPLKVLLVDDDKAVVDYLSNKLAAHYAIVSTTQPRNVVSLAAHERPDVILCDIDMPGMGGGEVAAALRNDPRTAAIPLIYLTAIATPSEIAELGGTVSGRPAVAKRASLQELFAAIAAAVQARAQDRS